jgi:protein-disulfide isomerase
MTLATPLDNQDHVLGPPDAPAVLVEYGDYECPFCGRAHVVVAQLMRNLGDRMRYAFRHFPLVQQHPHALMAAQAAEAAAAQGQFWPMHAVLLENQEALEPEDLVAYAQVLGLDLDRFTGELQAGTHRPRVVADIRSGVQSGVRSTPTFFVNGEELESWDIQALAEAVEQVGRPEQPARV